MGRWRREGIAEQGGLRKGLRTALGCGEAEVGEVGKDGGGEGQRLCQAAPRLAGAMGVQLVWESTLVESSSDLAVTMSLS